MHNTTITVLLMLMASSSLAGVEETSFSGNLTGPGANGTFVGRLIADWETGLVSEFYADVNYADAPNERYSMLSDFDAVHVCLANTCTTYWRNGDIDEYQITSAEDSLRVDRYERDQFGNLSTGPSPDWSIGLIITDDLWYFADNETEIVPCPGPSGYCWELVSSFIVYGDVTLIDASLPDADDDNIPDQDDNCTEVANFDQRDTDADGLGNMCDPDFDQSCEVNFVDLGILKAFFFLTGDFDADLDGDGSVNFLDLALMKASFFDSPGPSGVSNACDGS